MPSLNDISFISQDPIDKIVQQGEVSIVNDGATGSAYQTAKIVSSRVVNSAISIGCSNSTITFRTANGKHGNVTNTVSPVYTPTSRTFLIQYTLMERE